MQCCGYGRNAECGGLGGLGGASVVVRPASARTIAVGSCDRSPWATLVGAPVGYVPCLEISGTGRCGQCEAPGKRRARGWFRPCRGGAGCRLRTTSRPSHLSPVSGRRLGPGHTPVEQHSTAQHSSNSGSSTNSSSRSKSGSSSSSTSSSSSNSRGVVVGVGVV